MVAAFVIALAGLFFASSIVTLLIAAWMGACAKGEDRGGVHVPVIDRRLAPDHRENAGDIPPVEAVR